VDETFSIANGTVSATGTIIDNNNAPTVATITPASATEGYGITFYISNPSAVDTSVYFVQQMVRLEVRITRLLM
jgi:hypothetical protein